MARVLFINFEIQEWSFRNRLADVIKAKGLEDKADDFDTWTLRGHAADLTLIRPMIEKQIEGKGYQAIILDPNYMLMGERDENSAGDMSSLMNEFEYLATRTICRSYSHTTSARVIRVGQSRLIGSVGQVYSRAIQTAWWS